jgi:hypothetical protein
MIRKDTGPPGPLPPQRSDPLALFSQRARPVWVLRARSARPFRTSPDAARAEPYDEERPW